MARTRRQKSAQHDFFPGFTDITEIGTGSLAVVYRARETGTNRLVALKLLNVRDASPRAIESFERESVALGAISSHPNIVTLYRALRAADGRPVLVLELCTRSIAQGMHGQDGRGLPAHTVISLGIKIAAALETAHRAQILHRDVKPQNILLTEYGEPALADFGVAMLQSSTQTTAGLFDFTTLHAAPELLEGRATSAATDVYELASTLYQLVAGRSAFRAYDGESPASVILRILRDPVQPVIDTNVPTALSDLLVRAMSKDQADRPASAAEFAARLLAIEAAHGWPRTQFLISNVDGAPAELPRLPVPAVAPPPPMRAPMPPPSALSPAPAPGVPGVPGAPGAPGATEWSAPTVSRHAPPEPARQRTEPSPEDIARSVAVPQPYPVAPDPTPVPAPGSPAARAARHAAPDEFPSPAPPAPEPPAPPTPEPPRPPAPEPWAGPDAVHVGPTEAPRPQDLIVRSPDGSWTFQDAMPEPGRAPADVPFMPWRGPLDDDVEPGLPNDNGVGDAPDADMLEQPAQDGSPRRDPAPSYPIPPAAAAADPSANAVPMWTFRAQVPPGPSALTDLRLDPTTLRERVTIRAAGASLTVDAVRLVSRQWLKRHEIPWHDVLGLETRRDGDDPAADGVVLAITHQGPVELAATRGTAADLRYTHALLAAYRHRSRLQ